MQIQDRLAELFPKPRKRGLQAEIARLCGKSAPSVNAWFKDREKVQSIERSDAEKIVAAYAPNYSAAWLAEGTMPKHITESAPSNVEPGPQQHGPYPLISTVQAGNWTSLADNFEPGDAEEWCASTHNLGPRGYMLRVVGLSMYDPNGPYSFNEGEILHINPDLDPVPGQFVIARRNASMEATFKRYVLLDGEPYLMAINPDWPRELKYLKLEPGDEWCGVVRDVTRGYRLP